MQRFTVPLVLGLAALALPFIVPGAAAATIRLRADAYCPTNCAPDAARPGYVVEIAREVFERAGHRVDYDVLAWQRAIADTEAGLFEGVIGAGPGEVPGFVLGAEPIGVWQLGVAVRPGQDISLDPSAPFENLVVGAVEGYGYGEDWIEDYVAAHGDDPSRVQLLSGAAALSTNLRKLAAGRVDCVPDSVGVLRYHTHELRLDGQIEVMPASQERSEVFVAFSPKNPRSQEWAALLDRGVRELRASGRLREILQAYGLEDWR